MLPETEIALKNLEWLLLNRRSDDDGIDWPSRTFVRGDGGFALDELTRPGNTPATQGD